MKHLIPSLLFCCALPLCASANAFGYPICSSTLQSDVPSSASSQQQSRKTHAKMHRKSEKPSRKVRKTVPKSAKSARQTTQKEQEPMLISCDLPQQPRFPGGEAALLRYVANNTRYPLSCVENNVQGTVQLLFLISEAGAVDSVRVVRSLHPDADAEAIRVVKTLPRFIPARLHGKPQRAWFTLPVKFSLTK